MFSTRIHTIIIYTPQSSRIIHLLSAYVRGPAAAAPWLDDPCTKPEAVLRIDLQLV